MTTKPEHLTMEAYDKRIESSEEWIANTVKLEGSENTYLRMDLKHLSFLKQHNLYFEPKWFVMGVNGDFELIGATKQLEREYLIWRESNGRNQ
tara:strand:+ start:8713 stop:8991 length:279 start_codon:yes stop_codon:yes gene_type:complete